MGFNQRTVQEFGGQRDQALAVSPDNVHAVTGYSNGELAYWDLRSGQFTADSCGRKSVGLCSEAYAGPSENIKPNLYILAISINKNVDRGGKPPGTREEAYFPPLNFAVANATAFAEEMKKTSEGFYGRVQVTTALDEKAACADLDWIVQGVAAEIEPRDTFVLFAAAHGYSTKQNDRFYLIPQDYQGGTNPAALVSRAIGQDLLQDWVANRIKAKRAKGFERCGG